jgi:1,4-dihydroxy-2-naphthoate polyprenyltransferase
MMAARPKTLPAAAAPVLLGAGLAAHHGVFAWLPALAALLGALLIQVGTNLGNDYYDFVRGGDTEARVGPTRVTQAGLLEPRQVLRGMILVLAAAFGVGIYLVTVGGLPVVVIGLASLVCAVAYTGGPFPLAYHGLGDLFVFVFFGLIAVGGTYWVQALAWPPDALLMGAGIGALNTAILVANNLRDIESDGAAGKRTLAVRMGRGGTRVEYSLMLVVGAVAPVLGVLLFGWPPVAYMSLGAMLLAAGPLRLVWTVEDPQRLIAALGGTARVVAAYGILLAAGLTWG